MKKFEDAGLENVWLANGFTTKKTLYGKAVALWEKTGRVPLWADKHVRILWKAQEAGNETVKNVVERINLIDQLINQKIVVEATSRSQHRRV